MPDYIRTWKINNQIAELRDGTKGQPNGAVPLDNNGKIAYSLAKYYADKLAVSRDNSDVIASWATKVRTLTKLPTVWQSCDTLGEAYQLIKTVNNTAIAVGPSGIKYSLDGVHFYFTDVTSFSSAVTVECVEYLGGAYFVGCNLGLWRSTDLTTWTQVINYGVTHIAYDGIRYECVTTDSSASLKTSTDGTTWTTDTFFSSLGSVNTSTHLVWGVWYVDGIWWLNAYYTSNSTYTLFFYDGTHFSIPVTVGGISGIKWQYIHHTQNIDGLLQGNIWLIASEGTNGYSAVYCSEELYGVQWRTTYDASSVTTPFIEYKGKLYIGTKEGLAVLRPIGNYEFESYRLDDVTGQNPCLALAIIEDLLIVCGQYGTLYTTDEHRFYRALNTGSAYSMAVLFNKVLISYYDTTYNNTIMYSECSIPVPLYL